MVFGARKLRDAAQAQSENVRWKRNERARMVRGVGGVENAWWARNWWRLAVTAFNLANRSSFVIVSQPKQLNISNLLIWISGIWIFELSNHPPVASMQKRLHERRRQMRASIILHECAHRQHIALIPLCFVNGVMGSHLPLAPLPAPLPAPRSPLLVPRTNEERWRSFSCIEEVKRLHGKQPQMRSRSHHNKIQKKK